MSIQSKIVAEIFEEEKEKSGVIAVNVLGSVAQGKENKDSDVDIQIVSESARNWSLENKKRYGVKIDFEIYPKNKLVERVKKYPFLCYIYLNAKTIYDPTKFMEETLSEIREYFKVNTNILKFWKDKIRIKKELKTKDLGDGFSIKCYDEAELLFSEEHRITRDFFLGKNNL